MYVSFGLLAMFGRTKNDELGEPCSAGVSHDVDETRTNPRCLTRCCCLGSATS